MSYQESLLLQDLQRLEDDGFESRALRHLAMLHLNSTTPSPECTPATKTTKPHSKFKKCSQCGTLKRRSPSSSLREPSPKRANLHLTSSSNTTNSTASVDETSEHHHNLQEPVNLPALAPPNSTPWNVTPLHRSLSEPIYSEGTPFSETEKVIGPGSSSESGQGAVNLLSPEASKTTTSPSPSSAVVASLLRSISDPTVGDHGVTVAATNHQLPHVPRTLAPLSPVSEDSPNSKRLKRMKKRMKEMRKWVGEVMKEEEEEDDDDHHHISEDLNTNSNSKEETENEHQEAVWVEKKGEGLIIHFKCPCGEGYEIFLCGNNCYYKLM